MLWGLGALIGGGSEAALAALAIMCFGISIALLLITTLVYMVVNRNKHTVEVHSGSTKQRYVGISIVILALVLFLVSLIAQSSGVLIIAIYSSFILVLGLIIIFM